jgi:hypothetical protein
MDDRVRASSADRDRTAALLRAHFVAGRLTHDELDDRLAATLSASTFGDLRRALADLPAPGPVLADDSRLERGYRRLLALYPARYRQVHEEEMLAVLMTAAAERQHRPGLADAADLIIGALRVRCQTLRGGVPGWRGVLAVISAGTILGLLAGIPFATVYPPLQAAIANVRLAAPDGPATAQAQRAIASSYPVLARAALRIQPGMSEQALQRHAHISLLPDRVMMINVQVSATADAARAAAAVADSYIAYVSSKNAPGVTGRAHAARPMRVGETTVRAHAPQVLYVSSVALGSGSTDVLETSGLGALCGALIGAAIGAGARIPRSRRFRMT